MVARQQPQPEQLFYEFQLEHHVPVDHILRHAVLDLSAIRRGLEPYFASTGPPSVSIPSR